MSDVPKDVIEAAIRSASDSDPKEDDPDLRSPRWITSKELLAVALELDAITYKCLHAFRAVFKNDSPAGYQPLGKSMKHFIFALSALALLGTAIPTKAG